MTQAKTGGVHIKEHGSTMITCRDFPGGPEVKNSPANTGDIRHMGLIPGLQRFPGGGHGNLLQYSRLENPMDRGAWQAIQSIGSQKVRQD